MLNMPLPEIIEKIKTNTSLSEDEIKAKIDAKLNTLSGLISKEGAAHIIANELGVKLFEQVTGKLQIKNILSGMRSVETVGKVVAIYEVREFQKEERSGKVGNFVIGDETGTIRIVCWGSQADNIPNLKEGMVIKIKNGYVRENNGRKEIHMNDRASMVLNPEGESVGEVVTTKPESARKKISEIDTPGVNVELLGTIVQAYEPRFFEVCPECGKRMKQDGEKFVCEAHSTALQDYSYVMNVVLDDGSGTIRGVFFRESVEKLVGKNKQELIALKDVPTEAQKLKDDVLGNQIKIAGRITKNDMFDRLEIIANNVDPNPDPEKELGKVSAETPSTPAASPAPAAETPAASTESVTETPVQEEKIE